MGHVAVARVRRGDDADWVLDRPVVEFAGHAPREAYPDVVETGTGVAVLALRKD